MFGMNTRVCPDPNTLDGEPTELNGNPNELNGNLTELNGNLTGLDQNLIRLDGNLTGVVQNLIKPDQNPIEVVQNPNGVDQFSSGLDQFPNALDQLSNEVDQIPIGLDQNPFNFGELLDPLVAPPTLAAAGLDVVVAVRGAFAAEAGVGVGIRRGALLLGLRAVGGFLAGHGFVGVRAVRVSGHEGSFRDARS